MPAVLPSAAGTRSESLASRVSASGRSRLREPSSCLPQRRTWRSRKPAGRPNSARPTTAGSTACSIASTSTMAIARSRVGLLADLLELLRRAVRRALDLFHDVERCAEHRVVGAVREGPGDRHLGVREGGHHRVFAAHVVRGGLHVAQRRTPDHPRRRPVGDLVGQVGLATGDHPAAELAGQVSGPLDVVPTLKGGKVEAGHTHPSAVQLRNLSTLDWSFRMPASQWSVSAARAA